VVKESAVAESASTWMQVVFGGAGLSVAIVGLVIAYFAWVQPHSAGDDPGDDKPAAAPGAATSAAKTTTSATTAPPKQVPLSSLAATTGGSNLRPAGNDLTMACASGESDDRQRSVEYDLLGNYARLNADLTVPKARDGDTPLQVAVFADDRGAGTYTLKKDGGSRRLDMPLTGVGRLRLQLTCQFPDGEVRLGNPLLTHA
jgi:hypothetical protein